MDRIQTLTDKLQQCLKDLLGLHRQLLDTVKLEREALVNAELKAIQETTHAKEGLIARVQSEDQKRQKVVAELAMEWKKPLKELTIEKIILLVQDSNAQQSEALRSAYNAITIYIDRIRTQNEANRGLILESLEHVNEMKRNVLGEAVAHSDTYNASGAKQPSTGGARLLSKEA